MILYWLEGLCSVDTQSMCRTAGTTVMGGVRGEARVAIGILLFAMAD